MTKVLVTGGSGFIGKVLTSQLRSKGYTCLSCGRELSLSDMDSLIAVVKNFAPTHVIHLAGIANPVYLNREELYIVNTIGTENLLEAISLGAPKSRVILASTAGVYGNQSYDRIPETASLHPINHYSMSKACMELMSENFSKKLDISIVRIFNAIGELQSEKFIVPKLIDAFVRKVPEIKMGNLYPKRDFVDVDFVAESILEIALENKESLVLNICSGIGTSCQNIIDMLSCITKYSPKVLVDSNFVRQNEIYSLIGDPSKLFSKVSCRPQKVEKILTLMVDKYARRVRRG